MKSVGIEAIGLALPQRYLVIDDLAVLRGVEPAKFTAGLGARSMAVAEPGEDTVALAATAAARLMRGHSIDPRRIGMLTVGTETAVDHSKAVASFVQGLLGLPSTMRTFDVQHACYAGTAALMAACDWIASGNAHGRAALVVCADVARYGLRTAGEPTQGAGAVAMLVSDRPELLEIQRGSSGVYSADVNDFWRPIGRRDAVVDGHYSIQCYLDALAGAYRMWRGAPATAGLASASLARIAYHVPFCKMARKAHLQLRKCDLEDAKLDAANEEREGAASFETQVAASLLLPARVGNTYTAALYLALASLLHVQADELAGARIGMFSYGSGCSSEFYSGVVGEGAARVIARADIDGQLRRRKRIDACEYERIMNIPSDAPEFLEPAEGTFRFAGVTESVRRYVAG